MTERKLQGLAYPIKPLVDALALFDAGVEARNKAWDDIDSDADVWAAEAEDKKALQLVQDAFYEVTKDRNSHSNCRLVDLDFMRKCAAMGLADESKAAAVEA